VNFIGGAHSDEIAGESASLSVIQDNGQKLLHQKNLTTSTQIY